MSNLVAPWLINDYDFYLFNLRTELGSFHYYEDLHTLQFPVSEAWNDSEPDFYFLDLNLNPEGAGDFYYFEELDELKREVFGEDDSLDCECCDDLDLYPDLDYYDSDFCSPGYDDNWRDSHEISDEALSWSRNRQEEWYDLFRKEHDLTDEDYVDEQDILDWLGANFTITRTFTQEI